MNTTNGAIRVTPTVDWVIDMQRKLLELLRHLITYSGDFRLVRIGADGDGGYLIPDIFSDISDVVSIGISDDVSFDLDFANQGKVIHQFDPTVDGPPIANRNFRFYKEGFGVFENSMCHTLDSIITKCAIDDGKNKLLKFDVEGSEYSAFLASSREAMRQFSIVVGEFHALDWCVQENYYSMIAATFEKIAADFYAVHIHPNNGASLVVIDNVPIPPLVEITFVRKDLMVDPVLNISSKHVLDRRSVPSKSDIYWNPTHFFLGGG